MFAVNANGTGFATLYSFSAGSTNASGVYTNSDGASPQAGLILVANTIYGTTSAGGSWGDGTVFSVRLPGPQLSIIASGPNMMLTWPTSLAGYTLQRSVDLGSALWTAYTLAQPPVVTNGQFVVTIPDNNINSHQFFRLSQ